MEGKGKFLMYHCFYNTFFVFFQSITVTVPYYLATFIF